MQLKEGDGAGLEQRHPTLSIAIPTCNRARFLEQLLASVAGQVEVDWSRLEVVVSDNCSDDDTRQVVERYSAHVGCGVRYHRNDHNTGERNIGSVYWLAGGDYVWVIGDDDLLSPHAVSAVQRLIALSEPALLFLKGVGFRTKEDLAGLFEAGNIEAVTMPRTLFCELVNVHMSFISAVVTDARRVRALSSPEATQTLFGTGLIQYSWVLPMVWHGPIVYIDTPLLAGRLDNDFGGFGKFKVFVGNHHMIVRHFLGGDPELVPRLNARLLTTYLVGFIAPHKPVATLIPESLREKQDLLRQNFGTTWQYRLLVAPLFGRKGELSRSWLAWLVSSLRRKYNRRTERRLRSAVARLPGRHVYPVG